ncbi:MAG: hypothetical protein V7707_12700 [Motiliproteus sp.]
MQNYIFPLTLGLSVMLALPAAAADTVATESKVTDSVNRDSSSARSVDNSRQQVSRSDVAVAVDNSTSTQQQRRLALTRQYLMDQQYRSSQQQRNEQRGYSSAVGQGAGNSGQARGHQQDQQQGGVSVGSLVTESSGANNNGNGGGISWQYAPQSNTLMLGGDNNSLIQLSNVNANGGNVHIGDVNKGNLYNSQIGNNQQGSQGGDSVNAQSNSQKQQADSQAGSSDQMSN